MTDHIDTRADDELTDDEFAQRIERERSPLADEEDAAVAAGHSIVVGGNLTGHVLHAPGCEACEQERDLAEHDALPLSTPERNRAQGPSFLDEVRIARELRTEPWLDAPEPQAPAPELLTGELTRTAWEAIVGGLQRAHDDIASLVADKYSQDYDEAEKLDLAEEGVLLAEIAELIERDVLR